MVIVTSSGRVAILKDTPRSADRRRSCLLPHPLIDELPGSQMANDRWGRSARTGSRVLDRECHGAIIGRQPVGALNKQGFDAIDIRAVFSLMIRSFRIYNCYTYFK